MRRSCRCFRQHISSKRSTVVFYHGAFRIIRIMLISTVNALLNSTTIVLCEICTFFATNFACRFSLLGIVFPKMTNFVAIRTNQHICLRKILHHFNPGRRGTVVNDRLRRETERNEDRARSPYTIIAYGAER
jgi:hypothetical protein